MGDEMDKERLRRRLQEYLSAESAILAGQAYQIGDRSLTRPDLKYVQAQIDLLIAQLNDNAGAGVGSKRVVFI